MNLLAPLEFTEQEIGVFLRDNVCALCLGHLVAQPIEGRKFTAVCLEHGAILDWNYTSKSKANIVKSDRIGGERDIQKQKPPRPADEILKELGF